MKEKKMDEYRAFLMWKIQSLDGIIKSDKASYNQKRTARRRMNVYHECLNKYNDSRRKERLEEASGHGNA